MASTSSTDFLAGVFARMNLRAQQSDTPKRTQTSVDKTIKEMEALLAMKPLNEKLIARIHNRTADKRGLFTNPDLRADLVPAGYDESELAGYTNAELRALWIDELKAAAAAFMTCTNGRSHWAARWTTPSCWTTRMWRCTTPHWPWPKTARFSFRWATAPMA